MPLAHISEPLGQTIVRLDDAAVSRSHKPLIETLADAGGWEAPVEGSERYRMLDAALNARNTPYRFRGANEGHDAWSLLRTCAEYATERDCIDIERKASGWSMVNEQAARLAFLQWGLTEVRLRHAAPGDVLLFAMPDDCGQGPGVHPAILSSAGGELSWAMLPRRQSRGARMVHAYWGRSVLESWLGGEGDDFWQPKLVAAFSFDAGRKTRPYRLEAA